MTFKRYGSSDNNIIFNRCNGTATYNEDEGGLWATDGDQSLGTLPSHHEAHPKADEDGSWRAGMCSPLCTGWYIIYLCLRYFAGFTLRGIYIATFTSQPCSNVSKRVNDWFMHDIMTIRALVWWSSRAWPTPSRRCPSNWTTWPSRKRTSKPSTRTPNQR